MTFGTPVRAETNLTQAQLDTALQDFRSPAGGIMPGGVTLNGQVISCEMIHESTSVDGNQYVLFRDQTDQPEANQPRVYFGFWRQAPPFEDNSHIWQPLPQGLQEPANWPSTGLSLAAATILAHELILLHTVDRLEQGAKLQGRFRELVRLRLHAPQIFAQLEEAASTGASRDFRATPPKVEFMDVECALDQDQLREMWRDRHTSALHEGAVSTVVNKRRILLRPEFALEEGGPYGDQTLILSGPIVTENAEVEASVLLAYRNTGDRAAPFWQLWPKLARYSEEEMPADMMNVACAWVASKLIGYMADVDYEGFHRQLDAESAPPSRD